MDRQQGNAVRRRMILLAALAAVGWALGRGPLSIGRPEDPFAGGDVPALRTLLTGDVNGDGAVDATDYALLAEILAESNNPTIFPAAADLTADGRIDSLDLVLLCGLTVTLPRIVRFTASPTVIDDGGSAILSWQVAGALNVAIEPGVGEVEPGGGTLLVRPPKTTDYVLSARNSVGTARAVARVKVRPPCEPPSLGSQPADQTVTEGTTATLSLTAEGTSLSYQWY